MIMFFFPLKKTKSYRKKKQTNKGIKEQEKWKKEWTQLYFYSLYEL